MPEEKPKTWREQLHEMADSHPMLHIFEELKEICELRAAHNTSSVFTRCARDLEKCVKRLERM